MTLPCESSIRSRARRLGYRVSKSRRINFRLDDQGQYTLIDADSGFSVCGHYHDAELKEIADFLADEETAPIDGS